MELPPLIEQQLSRVGTIRNTRDQGVPHPFPKAPARLEHDERLRYYSMIPRSLSFEVGPCGVDGGTGSGLHMMGGTGSGCDRYSSISDQDRSG